MPGKIVFQIDAAGHYAGKTTADESPLEPGVFHIPAGCIEVEPPRTWLASQWPRWNGAAWELVAKPNAPATKTATQKLADFLAANPDVQELIANS